MNRRRIYEPCQFAVSCCPAWQLCGKPVRIERGRPSYCPEHSARMPIWPTADPADRPVALLANPEPQAFAHVERSRHDHA